MSSQSNTHVLQGPELIGGGGEMAEIGPRVQLLLACLLAGTYPAKIICLALESGGVVNYLRYAIAPLHEDYWGGTARGSNR